MSIRKILVPLDGSDRDPVALGTAFAAAATFGAHVAAIHVRIQPSDTLPFVGEGMSAALVQELMELTERESATRATAACETYERLRQSADIPVAVVPSSTGPSAEWLEETGREEDAIVVTGRLADLIVLSRPGSSGSIVANGTFSIALFETGRPVLVAGIHGEPNFAGHIVVAWDGSAQAARALAAGLPFLARAEQVTVVTVREAGGDEEDLAEVTAYLAWHGIAAERRVMTHHSSVAEALIAAASDADLLVMGGYSHSRLRELILGGVTRHMLEKAALPLLLAH